MIKICILDFKFSTIQCQFYLGYGSITYFLAFIKYNTSQIWRHIKIINSVQTLYKALVSWQSEQIFGVHYHQVFEDLTFSLKQGTRSIQLTISKSHFRSHSQCLFFHHAEIHHTSMSCLLKQHKTVNNQRISL